jgi:hypothetical protein
MRCIWIVQLLHEARCAVIVAAGQIVMTRLGRARLGVAGSLTLLPTIVRVLRPRVVRVPAESKAPAAMRPKVLARCGPEKKGAYLDLVSPSEYLDLVSPSEYLDLVSPSEYLDLVSSECFDLLSLLNVDAPWLVDAALRILENCVAPLVVLCHRGNKNSAHSRPPAPHACMHMPACIQERKGEVPPQCAEPKLSGSCTGLLSTCGSCSALVYTSAARPTYLYAGQLPEQSLYSLACEAADHVVLATAAFCDRSGPRTLKLRWRQSSVIQRQLPSETWRPLENWRGIRKGWAHRA